MGVRGGDEILSDVTSELIEREGALLRQIVELFPVGLSVQSPDGRLIFGNAAAMGHGGNGAESAPASLPGNVLARHSAAMASAPNVVPIGGMALAEKKAPDGRSERTLWTSQRS